ncbi:MAG: DNA phosphorothioation system sulfurtransferase DndC [Erysipelotrichaceae bacterium]|nr:DNA phosphorothioation system sulfurtransferase DndC [Erysipelotrichaceae bacterium]
MAITKEYIEHLKKVVQDLYMADAIPWMIGYSGGKDSTAALQLVWMAIADLPREYRNKTIYVINTNTMVESPVVSRWAFNSLKKLDEIAKEKYLPFKSKTLYPEISDTFWVNLLGRGYPFPRKKFRWCTDRLKIKPVNQFVKERIAEHGEIIMVLGTRKAESAKRNKTMTRLEKKRIRELLSPSTTQANELVFSPLEEWTDDDVWIFLMQYANPWNYSNQELLTLYKGATADNECPMMVQEDLPSCGKSRFGCWVCTMVSQDKSMEAMISNDEEKEWMTPLLEFRNEFGDEEHDRERRSFRKLGGFLAGSYKRLHHGPYKKEWREHWLKRLLEVQKEINEYGPEEFSDLELITLSELQEIRRIWVYQKHEFADSLPKIYEETMGSPFYDPKWTSPGPFGQEEWDLLKEICKEEYPDEELVFEMLYSLIDIENQASLKRQRKGILQQLESSISSTFYKNEEDAFEYYQAKNQRKKEAGVKYNEKFLMDYYNPETDSIEDQLDDADLEEDKEIAVNEN